MRAVFQLPASMTSVVDAPRAVSSDASPTRPLCAVTRASMPAARRVRIAFAAASADGQAALRGAADAFRNKGKDDKARRVASVASMARTAARMVALAAEIAPKLNAELNEELNVGLRLVLEVAHVLQTTEAGGGWTALMPLFSDALHDDVHVPLIDLADVATGERAVSTGRGAAHELRLLFEGVTGIGVAVRTGYGELIAWTVGELLEAFYRGGGKVRRSGERPGDWELIRRACRWISGAAIPWRVPSGNAQPWAIMTLRSLPGERPALREAGRVSSPAFRIGVAVPSTTWIPGRTRRPVRGVGGLWIGDASRYPVFSARDRRRIAFGPESTHRPGGIDNAWHKSADAAGVVILDTEAVDRDGKRGWIVVPAAAAKAIRKATK